jgi:hypothetical protein
MPSPRQALALIRIEDPGYRLRRFRGDREQLKPVWYEMENVRALVTQARGFLEGRSEPS